VLNPSIVGLIAGVALVVLGWNLPAVTDAVTDAIGRFGDGFGTVRPPARPTAAGEHRAARTGFVAAGAGLILLALLAPLLL
jgi:hypothetical protein